MGSKPIRSNVSRPTTSLAFSRVFATFMTLKMSLDFTSLQREFLGLLPFGFQLVKRNVDEKIVKIPDLNIKPYTGNYRRVPIVATLVTLGISSLWGSLLSGGRYFRGVVTFGEQKSFTNKAGTSFFSEIKNEQHKIKKRTTFYLHSICIDCVS